jgi:hypothetical protein
LAGDLNAKHPLWNSRVSNPSGLKLIDLFDMSDFEISAPQFPTHYSPAGNGDVLDIVVHQNIRMMNNSIPISRTAKSFRVCKKILDYST